MGIFGKRQGPWTAGLLYWAIDAAKNPSATDAQKERAQGVALYAAFSIRRGPNPYEMNGLSPDVLVGIRDANRLVNSVIENGVVPKGDYQSLLITAHNEVVSRDMNEKSPEIQSIENDMQSIMDSVSESIKNNPALDPAIKEQLIANLQQPLPAIEGLSEDRYVSQYRDWAVSQLEVEKIENYRSQFLQGAIKAMDVHDKKIDALLIDADNFPGGAWEGHTSAFMEGYSTLMKSWGHEEYFTRVAFSGEIAEGDIELAQKISKTRLDG